MIVEDLPIDGPLLLRPRVFGDERGYFVETFQETRYAEAGLPTRWVQDNLSLSQPGVLRGMHFQHPDGQGKLVTVLQGAVKDVIVDIRPESATFGHHLDCTLDGDSKTQLWVPPGFAHGFVTLEPDTLFHYKVTEFWAPEHEHTLAYDDPSVGIVWPEMDLVISQKDQEGISLDEVRELVSG
jgi:dTDP-4-dehydrorhamnose 3,5-epimerase